MRWRAPDVLRVNSVAGRSALGDHRQWRVLGLLRKRPARDKSGRKKNLLRASFDQKDIYRATNTRGRSEGHLKSKFVLRPQEKLALQMPFCSASCFLAMLFRIDPGSYFAVRYYVHWQSGPHGGDRTPPSGPRFFTVTPTGLANASARARRGGPTVKHRGPEGSGRPRGAPMAIGFDIKRRSIPESSVSGGFLGRIGLAWPPAGIPGGVG